MTLDSFKESLKDTMPPALPLALQVMWFAGKGEWATAHDLLQNGDSPEGAWVHAYLHRKEGDASNAGYWYRRAGKPMPKGSLDTEWETIVTSLL
jgi:hypothetical protein